MSGLISHPVSQIVQQLLIDLLIGTDPTESPQLSWPVFYSSEPPSPDNCITVYDTESKDDGRNMVDGVRNEHYGFQLRVRAQSYTTGNAKCQTICDALDSLLRVTLTVNDESGTGSSEYEIHSVSRSGRPIHLGRRPPIDRLDLFTINAFVTLAEV